MIGCTDSAGDPDGGSDDGSDDGSEDDVEDPGATWLTMREDGDPADDCTANDVDCEADIVQLYHARYEGVLYLDLHFNNAFPADAGAFELFLIPKGLGRIGHTIQFNNGQFVYWDVDCSNATKDSRHDGCHWSNSAMPGSFVSEWTEGDRFLCQVSVADLGFEELTKLLMGVGAAPFSIQQTAQFTDRYPDELWVYSTEIAGLQRVPFVEE
ncbi:MAG: hypothetical protein HN348_03200 [Proteobacteria bacterium]|nr:hypothetical protein [Pseudomonadota bacterium]